MRAGARSEGEGVGGAGGGVEWGRERMRVRWSEMGVRGGVWEGSGWGRG